MLQEVRHALEKRNRNRVKVLRVANVKLKITRASAVTVTKTSALVLIKEAGSTIHLSGNKGKLEHER